MVLGDITNAVSNKQKKVNSPPRKVCKQKVDHNPGDENDENNVNNVNNVNDENKIPIYEKKEPMVKKESPEERYNRLKALQEAEMNRKMAERKSFFVKNVVNYIRLFFVDSYHEFDTFIERLSESNPDLYDFIGRSKVLRYMWKNRGDHIIELYESGMMELFLEHIMFEKTLQTEFRLTNTYQIISFILDDRLLFFNTLFACADSIIFNIIDDCNDELSAEYDAILEYHSKNPNITYTSMEEAD